MMRVEDGEFLLLDERLELGDQNNETKCDRRNSYLKAVYSSVFMLVVGLVSVMAVLNASKDSDTNASDTVQMDVAAWATAEGTTADGFHQYHGWFEAPYNSEEAADIEKGAVVVAIALRQQNLEELDRKFWAVSNPLSETRGKYLTRDEVRAMTSDDQARNAVTEFLASQTGVSVVPHLSRGSFVGARMDVMTANQLLHTTFTRFRHTVTGDHVMRAKDYALPRGIAKFVEFVDGVTQLPTGVRVDAPSSKFKADYVSPPASVTPDVLASTYSLGADRTISSRTAGSNSIYASLYQSYSPADLSQYQGSYDLAEDPVEFLEGTNAPGACEMNVTNCIEANLDVQTISAVAWGADTTFWSVEEVPYIDPFLRWLIQVEDAESPPLVHSVSYGGDETYVTPTAQARLDTELQKLGLRGVTILVASGDSGSGGAVVIQDPALCSFTPDYPATSPFITVVGATQGPESGGVEITCQSQLGGVITSGGGFSKNVARPSYQDEAVNGYLQSGVPLPPTAPYMTTGRGYPDVSLLGLHYDVVVGGQSILVSGTSASTPAMAGIVSLLNDAREGAGKGPVGFLNPTLYQIAKNPDTADAFNDITSGTSNCAAGYVNPVAPPLVCCPEGYTAGVGWDPLTGLGSVNFQRLKEVVVDLP